MLTPSISAADSMGTCSPPRARPWRAVTAGLRAPSVPRERQAALACFGTLPVKEQMVLKGLSASLRCSAAEGKRR